VDWRQSLLTHLLQTQLSGSCHIMTLGCEQIIRASRANLLGLSEICGLLWLLETKVVKVMSYSPFYTLAMLADCGKVIRAVRISGSRDMHMHMRYCQVRFVVKYSR
jgi:hypothetical protein